MPAPKTRKDAAEPPSEAQKAPSDGKKEEPPLSTQEKVQAFLPLVIIAVVLGIAILLFNIFTQGEAPDARCANALLGGWKDNCYYSLATQTMNGAYCLRINETSLHDACLMAAGTLAANASACADFSDSLIRDQCYLGSVNATGSEAPCTKIVNAMYADQCFLSAAYAHLDAAPCASIRNNASRIGCVNSISVQLALRDGNPSLCRGMEYPDEPTRLSLVDNCYYALAANQSDASLCAYIANETIHSLCVSNVGPQTPQVPCEQQSAPGTRDTCFFTRALATNATADCGAIAGAATKDYCYVNLARQLGDLTICEFVVDANTRRLCGGSP